MSKVLNWVAKHYWLMIALVALLILSWEVLEAFFPKLHSWLGLKLLVYQALLLLIGWMLDFSSQKINIQSETMKILDYKHRLSQEFSIRAEWEGLINYMVRLPGTIAAVDQSYLFVTNPLSEQFECVACWNEAGNQTIDSDAMRICWEYLDKHLPNNPKFGSCEGASTDYQTSPQTRMFCLPLQYGENLLGVLQFRLKDGKALEIEQARTFENIGDEIAIALKIGQERKAFDEMSSTQAALDERRTVSHYLHDNLSQNLGYVHFKLGQLISEMDQLDPQKMRNDLELMRDAASESYDIVRGTLETINQETTPLLTNLLVEHARKVAQRAKFEIAFKTIGKPVPIDANVQRAIYYVFQESLSNVERHAQASKVDVRAEWAEDHFELSIRDNGVGFNPETVNTNQHLGLEIMRERLAKVEGRVMLNISKSSGTLVNVWVPTAPLRMLRVAHG